MILKKFNIYAILISILIVGFRGLLDFTWGDSEAFRTVDAFQGGALRNLIANRIFAYTNVIGEIIFGFLYYRNTFILSDLISDLTPLKNVINKKFLSFAVLISLFSPVSILFTSFAGKDILVILFTSILCINLLELIKNRDLYKWDLLKIIFLISILILTFVLRQLTGLFCILLFSSVIVFYTKVFDRKTFIFMLLAFAIFLIINFNLIYLSLYRTFAFLLLGTIIGEPTFRVINPDFSLSIYFYNFYQAFTGINIVHLNDSFYKAIALFINSLFSYIPAIIYNFYFWLKNNKISIFIFMKIIFIAIYLAFFAFLSQNNPAGAVRYYSSILPLLITFLFIIMPKQKTDYFKDFS